MLWRGGAAPLRPWIRFVSSAMRFACRVVFCCGRVVEVAKKNCEIAKMSGIFARRNYVKKYHYIFCCIMLNHKDFFAENEVTYSANQDAIKAFC